MRTLRSEQVAPEGALRLVGMLSGALIEPIGIDESSLAEIGFTGERGKVQAVVGPEGPVMVVGLGDEVDWESLYVAVASAVRSAPRGHELSLIHISEPTRRTPT